ncbi:MAG: glutamate synthase subunit beta [Candidatus Aadella gelida]|nr:glutamate synthase subunit beta [Candidatus Aadella gelida]
MGDPKGFLKGKRQDGGYRPVCERVKDYEHVSVLRKEDESLDQAERCMDCGTPFCHWGCPIGNYIPEWNDLMAEGHWEKAFKLLNASNNLPEITGRICPAPCEHACVLGINDDAISIRENELGIIEYAFKKKMIAPEQPMVRTDKKVAIVGSGPAGLSCAMQLNKAGHDVTVFEKYDKAGGILRYGIPDFKLEKWILDRRIEIMEDEGIEFKTSVNVGSDYKAKELMKTYNAVCLAGGSRKPRDLSVEGRKLSGIHFAMDYLIQSNIKVSGTPVNAENEINASGKKVVVIGGGDTGSDCVGTANRQGASCVMQIEIMSRPEECRTKEYPWPTYPLMLKTSSSHEEGSEREWSILTKKFIGENGAVKKLECSRVEFINGPKDSCPVMIEIPGSTFEIESDLIILALGFLHPAPEGLLSDLGVKLDERGNVKTGEDLKTSVEKVFSAGDMRRGQSLIVWAISEGRKAAHFIDRFLMGETNLPNM